MDARECVLIIRHFPSELTIEDATELLRNFGSIRTVKHNRKNVVYSTFSCKSDAKLALSRLHQLKILNRRLVVEFADEFSNEYFNSNADNPSWSIDSAKKTADGEEATSSNTKRSDLQEKLHDFSRNLNAVGKAFGLDFPMSAKLFYSYPRPSASTLHNINNALVAVPKFYFQVLHLMNKMNLPAPFGPAVDFPELPLAAEDEMAGFLEEEESELESDVDDSTRALEKALFLEKRRRPTKRMTSKRPKLQPTIQKDPAEFQPSKDFIRPTEVFEVPTTLHTKKIEFKLDVSHPANTVDTNVPVGDGFGTFEPVENLESGSETPVETASVSSFIEIKFASEEELARNRISREELEMLPVFKNYEPGKPTRRLYLKNLAKQVVEEDLSFIYRRYVDDNDEKSTFDIRLMKEGRMKGQAFVTLKDEDCALKALQQTNGYVLHGKPIVVQFAKCNKSD